MVLSYYRGGGFGMKCGIWGFVDVLEIMVVNITLFRFMTVLRGNDNIQHTTVSLTTCCYEYE